MTHEVDNLPPPSQTDLKLLAILWDKGHATGREVHQSLLLQPSQRSALAYTTVKTYLDRLVQKGYATAQVLDDGRATHVYSATIPREDVLEHPSLIEQLISTLGLGLPWFAQWFYKHGKLSRKDKAEIEKILQNLPDTDHPC